MMIVTNPMKKVSDIMTDNLNNGNPKLKNVDPRKLVVLMELIKKAEGKSIDELLPLIISTNKKLQEQNLTFTKDESEIMIDILTKNLSPKEKAQFNMLRKLMLK